MRFVRNGSGSPSIVCLILSLLSIGIVYAASIPAPRRDSASIAGNLNRRADSSPADADSPYDYGTPPLWSLESEQPDVNYPAFIAAGGTLDEAMRKNTDTLEADLIATDKLPKGQQLASQFTDPSAFESNGWKQDDRTPDLDQFALYAPITTSLQSLGISTSGWPSGNNHFTSYQHTLPWQHEGQEMKPAGKNAKFEFISNPTDGSFIITYSYSTEYVIRKAGSAARGIISPPLSHNSDLTFLDWKRTCDLDDTNPSSLKHLFILTINTPLTREVFKRVFLSRGKTLTDLMDVPKWDRKEKFLPGSDEGKALLNTPQLKGMFWMFAQHLAHLGKKVINNIYVYRDDLTGTLEVWDPEYRGPTIYLELEDVQ